MRETTPEIELYKLGFMWHGSPFLYPLAVTEFSFKLRRDYGEVWNKDGNRWEPVVFCPIASKKLRADMSHIGELGTRSFLIEPALQLAPIGLRTENPV